MRPREVEKLLCRILESLYLEQEIINRAWGGTVVRAADRVNIIDIDGNLMDIDSMLPEGETGKLIWIKD